MKKVRSLLLALILTAVAYSPANAARLSLSPASGEFITGCSYPLNMIIDTEGGDSLAADAVVNYNPNEVEIVGNVGVGHVYDAYPGNQVGGGVIRLTGFNRSGFFNGRGVLGVIKFKGKPGVSNSTISYQFSPGSSADSNIANAESVDILSGVGSANLSFKSGECPRAAAPAKAIKEPPGESMPEKTEEVAEISELEACKNALLVLENLEREESGGKELLCEEISKLKPAAPTKTSSLLLAFLIGMLLMSLATNMGLIYGYKRTKVVSALFTTKPIRKRRKKRA